MELDDTSPFVRHKLTQEEYDQARALSPYTRALLQNLLSLAAEQKMNLVFTPNDINTYLQQEAELTGQINVLTYILSLNPQE